MHFLDENPTPNPHLKNKVAWPAEGSRKVSAYGERYHYKGSNGSAKPIPEALAWLISKVKEEMHLDYDPKILKVYQGELRVQRYTAYTASRFTQPNVQEIVHEG